MNVGGVADNAYPGHIDPWIPSVPGPQDFTAAQGDSRDVVQQEGLAICVDVLPKTETRAVQHQSTVSRNAHSGGIGKDIVARHEPEYSRSIGN